MTHRRTSLTGCCVTQVVRHELLPYLVRCFHRLYPHASVSSHVLDMRAFDDVLRELELVRVADASSP